MANVSEKIVEQLNQALELEHAVRIQYLAQAELVKGIHAEKIIERLYEFASDEEKHAKKFCNLIGSYLDGEPSMGIAKTRHAKETKGILEVNLQSEKEAIDHYKQIYRIVIENKENLQYKFETLEHELRHVIIDERQHVAELSLLLGL